jgi:hypothetical protein
MAQISICSFIYLPICAEWGEWRMEIVENGESGEWREWRLAGDDVEKDSIQAPLESNAILDARWVKARVLRSYCYIKLG